MGHMYTARISLSSLPTLDDSYNVTVSDPDGKVVSTAITSYQWTARRAARKLVRLAKKGIFVHA